MLTFTVTKEPTIVIVGRRTIAVRYQCISSYMSKDLLKVIELSSVVAEHMTLSVQ